MSFSKAKLLRFNDVNSITPSPADYTILDSIHIAGAALSKSERFAELASPASSDVSSHHSSCAAPVFRTPNPPPRRKPKTNSTTSLKPLELFQSDDAHDALKEKIVECNNKDQYINELMEQVEDMKQQLNGCNSELSQLTLENSRLAESLANINTDKEVLVNDQQKHLSNVNEKLIKVYHTYNKIDDVNVTNSGRSDNLNSLLENIGILDDLLESHKIVNDRNVAKLEEKDQQLLELEHDYFDLQKKHNDEIINVRQVFEKQIENIQLKQTDTQANFVEELKLKSILIEQAEIRFTQLQEFLKIEKERVTEENEIKIKQITENFKEASVLADIQFEERIEEIETDWRSKLKASKNETNAILKECQAIAEYNVIQSEVEKNQVIYEFAQYKNTTQSLKEDHDKLQDKFTHLTNHFKSLAESLANAEKSKTEVETELKICQGALNKMNKDKHKYEVTLMNTHTLIDTLKNRLLNSDQDVEQLKTELEDTEASKLESEDRCNKLEGELQTVLKLFDKIDKEMRAARKESKEKVQQVEQDLLLKVDCFKNEADSTIAVLNNTLCETKSKLDDALKHLHKQQILNIEAQTVIENSLREIDILKVCCKCAENEGKCNAFLQKLEEVELENRDLHKKVIEQESLIGPFREQLTEYEAMINEKYHVEQEAKELGLKYAQLIGHQNQRQKIKHLIDLKKKNSELAENIVELEGKVRQQNRTIEKLKKDLSSNTKISKKKAFDDKENIPNSLNRTFNYTSFSDNTAIEDKD